MVGIEFEATPPGYEQRVGERLRAVRKQKRLSLQAVEAESDHEFKASVLLAGAGVIFGTVLGGLLEQKWSPFDLNNTVEWIWWLGAASAVAGLVALALAITPRTRRPHDNPQAPLRYYADVASKSALSEADFLTELRGAHASALLGVVDQLRQVSALVATKYGHISRAFRFFGAGVLAITVSALLSVLTS